MKKISTKITYNNKTLTIEQWAADNKINQQTLITRLKRGWSMKRALTPTLPRLNCSRLTPVHIQQLHKYYLQGYTCVELGKLFRKDVSTIFHHIKKLKNLPSQKPTTPQDKQQMLIRDQKRLKKLEKQRMNAYYKNRAKIKPKNYQDFLKESKKRDKKMFRQPRYGQKFIKK